VSDDEGQREMEKREEMADKDAVEKAKKLERKKRCKGRVNYFLGEGIIYSWRRRIGRGRGKILDVKKRGKQRKWGECELEN
jgi:hypothetical protein